MPMPTNSQLLLLLLSLLLLLISSPRAVEFSWQHSFIVYMQYSPNLSTLLFLTYDPKSPDVIGEHHLL